MSEVMRNARAHELIEQLEEAEHLERQAFREANAAREAYGAYAVQLAELVAPPGRLKHIGSYGSWIGRRYVQTRVYELDDEGRPSKASLEEWFAEPDEGGAG